MSLLEKELLVCKESKVLLDQLDLIKVANMNEKDSVPTFFLFASELLETFPIHHEQVVNSVFGKQLLVDSFFYEIAKQKLFEFAFFACTNYVNKDSFKIDFMELHQAIQISKKLIQARKYHLLYPEGEGYAIAISKLPVDYTEYRKQYSLFQNQTR